MADLSNEKGLNRNEPGPSLEFRGIKGDLIEILTEFDWMGVMPVFS